MLDRWLRVPKDRVLAALVPPLERVHPTTITVVAAGVGLAAAGAAATSLYLPALGLWLLNRTLDGLDGTLARRTGKQSDLGGYLDILLDFVVYAALPLGLAYAAGTVAAWAAVAILLASFYVNAGSWLYLAALLEKRNVGAAAQGEQTTVTMPPGVIEGTETVLFYVVLLLFPAWLVPLALAMAALTLISSAQRVWWAARHL